MSNCPRASKETLLQQTAAVAAAFDEQSAMLAAQYVALSIDELTARRAASMRSILRGAQIFAFKAKAVRALREEIAAHPFDDCESLVKRLGEIAGLTHVMRSSPTGVEDAFEGIEREHLQLQVEEVFAVSLLAPPGEKVTGKHLQRFRSLPESAQDTIYKLAKENPPLVSRLAALTPVYGDDKRPASHGYFIEPRPLEVETSFPEDDPSCMLRS